MRNMSDDGTARATAWLTAWDAQGIHRTATAGDEAGADWLIGEAAGVGAAPGVEDFALDRLDPIDAYLECGGEHFPGVPVFDAPTTSAGGIAGTLGPIGGPVGAEAAIAVTELSPGSVYTPDYERLRRDPLHRSLVIVCMGAQPGLGLLNAERFRRPYGARSWWQSTAERGGGLVCWLEALRALLAFPPLGDVVFTANSGHELGHLGLDEFMSRRPGWERPVAAGGAVWVHFGANIGAVGGDLSIQSASDDLRALTAAELTRAGRPADRIAPKTLVPSGETRDIHRAGGRYVTLVGSNPLFHLPQDRWPHAVDVAAVARIAAAAAGLVVKLTR